MAYEAKITLASIVCIVHVCIVSVISLHVCLLYVMYTCVVELLLVEPEAMDFNQTQNKRAMVCIFKVISTC